MLDKLTTWAFKQKAKDGLLSAALKLGYQIIASPVIQGVVGFIAPIIAGAYIIINGEIIKSSATLWAMAYLVYLVVVMLANTYRNKKIVNYILMESTLEGNVTLLSQIREKMFDRVAGLVDGTASDNVFKKASEYVVEEIYSSLEKYYKQNCYRVTVFQRICSYEKSKNGEEVHYCKMVAYRNRGDDVPERFRKSFQLNKNEKKKHLFVRLFETDTELSKKMNSRNILFLENHQEILEEFKIEKHASVRTCQYIGAPVALAGNFIGFLVQVCSYENNGFGSRREREEFMEKMLFPSLQVLKVAYEYERLAELVESESKEEVLINV